MTAPGPQDVTIAAMLAAGHTTAAEEALMMAVLTTMQPAVLADTVITDTDHETCLAVFWHLHEYLFAGELTGDCPHQSDPSST